MSVEKRLFRNFQSEELIGFDEVGNSHESAIKKRKDSCKAGLRALQRFADAHGLQIYFLTLTMGNPVWGVRTLNRYMSFLRGRFARKGLLFKYKWVLEPQETRFDETGVLAPHWHIAVAALAGTLPNVEYLGAAPRKHRYHLISDGSVVKQRDMFKYWSYGQELCQPARGSLVDYLMKYVTKGLGIDGLGRRIGGSMLLWWRIAEWAFECIYEFYSMGLDVLKWRFSRGDIARLLHFTVTDGLTMETYKVLSPWRRVLTVNDDA